MSETDEAAKNVPSPEKDCKTPAVDLSDVLKIEYKIIDESCFSAQQPIIFDPLEWLTDEGIHSRDSL